ncbi:hypothetical protein [Iningainema tapete]|uniref:Uncharacterized protein n=1 Tax=Iningainema tapete BLCC-T55 TaxID=2748662 RepID=A0A8J6XL90_9CYAN|nr:hypothetical protein [Iningainema tapete]MBD2772507.1 hypothetical protein [Iningainema tapete BLCC-T55]
MQKKEVAIAQSAVPRIALAQPIVLYPKADYALVSTQAIATSKIELIGVNK